MWIKRILESLFPGDQLKTVLQMIAVFAMIILVNVLRTKIRQRDGGSGVFLTKQRLQTLFRKDDDADE